MREPASRLIRVIEMFGFQRLDAYRCAIQFLAQSAELAQRAPRGYAVLSDQLRRAALSITLNIAEGSGKTDRDASRFYSIARGSALECTAILDALEVLAVVDSAGLQSPRDLLERVVSMLTKLRKA